MERTWEVQEISTSFAAFLGPQNTSLSRYSLRFRPLCQVQLVFRRSCRWGGQNSTSRINECHFVTNFFQVNSSCAISSLKKCSIRVFRRCPRSSRSFGYKIRFVVNAHVTPLIPNRARRAKPVILKTFWSRMCLGNQSNLVSIELVTRYLASARISRIERSWLKPCVMCFGEKIQHSQ